MLKVDRCNMCNSSQFIVLGKRLNTSQGFNPNKKIGLSTTVVKCKSCGLVFANPIPIPDLLGDHYDVEVYDYFQTGLGQIDNETFKYEIDYFKSIYSERGPLKALDIGCGLGRIVKAMQRASIEAYGIEPSKTFYDFAITKMGIEKERLRNTAIENTDFDAETFDFINFSAVFEHLYNPNESLQKALSWLKPKGIIYIGVPSSNSLNTLLINWMYKLRGLDYVSNISPMHPPFHIYEFTLNSFKKNSLLNNFTIEKVERVTYKTYLPQFLDFIVRPFLNLTKTDMNIHIWLRKKE
jgi:SAM-dependent methyltransferase